MKIKTITSQSRRDFTAVYVCDHCEDEHTGSGYDDSYFHNTVIPAMKCAKCGLTSRDDYQPRSTKYPAGQQV